MAKSGQMQGLLSEFRGVYEDRLRDLDVAEASGEDRKKMRLRVLTSYVKDLSEQNEVLVQTVEELEREANGRVELLESKLQRSAAALKDYVNQVRDSEREMRAARSDCDKLSNSCKDLESRLDRAERQSGRMQEENVDYKHNVNALIGAINTARSSGRWDLENVKLRGVDPEQVFGRGGAAAGVVRGAAAGALESHVTELREQVRQRDALIDQLRADLRHLHDEAHRTQERVHVEEHARSTAEGSLSNSLKREQAVASDAGRKELIITRLQDEIVHGQATIDALKAECGSKDRRVAALLGEVTDLGNELAIRETERSKHTHSFQVLQDNACHYQTQLNECEDTIRRLKADLACTQDTANNHARANTDTAYYEQRIRQLEEELQVVKEEKRRSVDEIGELQNKLRSGTVSQQDHHEVLKGELARRDDTIQKLRRDVLSLQEKRDTYQSQLDTYEDKVNEFEKELHVSDTEIQKRDNKVRDIERDLADSGRKHEDARNELEEVQTKLTKLDAEHQCVRLQHADSLTQVQKLTTSLQKLQNSSKDTRDALTGELSERHDALLRLKGDVKELEEKHRDALGTINHRGDVIKTIRDDLKQANTRAQEAQDRCLVLDREFQHSQDTCQELSKNNDRLHTKIQEQGLTWSQVEMEQRGDLADREEQIAKLMADVRVLEERLSQNQQQAHNVVELAKRMQQRDEQVAELQASMQDSQLVVDSRDKLIDKLQFDFQNAKEDHRIATDELQRCEISLQSVAAEVGTVRVAWLASVEECGRLEARFQSSAIDARSEHEQLASEVRLRDESVQALRLDSMTQQESLAALEEKTSQLERVVEQLGVQLDTAKAETTTARDSCRQHEESVAHERERCTELAARLTSLEDEQRDTSIQLSSAMARGENQQHNVQVKEELIQQLKADYESLQKQQRELIAKITSRDEAVQKLNSEVGRLRSIKQDKVSEVGRQSESIKRLQQALVQAQQDLDDTRRRSEDKICARDENIKNLQEELSEAQSQYTTCYNDVLRLEDQLENVRLENSALSESLKRTSTDLLLKEESIQAMELELTISQEKHRTSQQEVVSRNDVILKLHAEVDTASQQSSWLQEELNLRDDEVQRLQTGVRQKQADIKELQGQAELAEQRLRQEKSTTSQQSLDYHVTLQELRNKDNLAEQWKADMTLMKNAHGEELQRLQQDVQILRDDLALAHSERDDVATQLAGHKARADQLAATLDDEREEHAAAQHQLEKSQNELRDAERLLSECQQTNIVLEGELEQAGEETERLRTSLDMYKQKFQACTEQIGSMEETLNNVQDKLMQSSSKEKERELDNDSLRMSLVTLEATLEDRVNSQKHSDSLMVELTNELQTTQEDFNDTLKLLEDSNKTLTKHKELVLQLQCEGNVTQCLVVAGNDKLRFIDHDLQQYKEHHSHTNKDWLDQQEHIRQLEFGCEELRAEGQLKSRQIHTLQESVQQLKSDGTTLRDQKDTAHTEINRLEQSLQQLQNNLASAQQKHRMDVAKLSDCVRSLEADVGEARRVGQATEADVQRRGEQVGELQGELRLCKEDATRRAGAAETLEAALKEQRLEIANLERDNRAAENTISELQMEVAHLKAELNGARDQYKEAAQELAHHEEKLVILEQSLSSTQETLSARVGEVVRLEQGARKLNTELKTMRERNTAAEEELADQKETIDKQQADVYTCKQELHDTVQEAATHKQNAARQQVELEGIRQQERMLNEQVEGQDNILSQLQTELKSERAKHQDAARQLTSAKKQVTELHDEIDQQQKHERELINRIRERESTINACREESEQLGQRLRYAKEELADHQGQLRVATMSVDTLTKQNQHHMTEVGRYENNIAQLTGALEKSKALAKSEHESLLTAQGSGHQSSMQLASLQAQHKETLAQLAERSKAAAQLKADLDRATGQTTHLQHELAAYENKVRALKQDVNNLQDVNRHSDNECENCVLANSEMRGLRARVADLEEDLGVSGQRNKQSLGDLAGKEEELVVLKVELAALQDKYRNKVDDADKSRAELESLRARLHASNEEVTNLKLALEESRANGERLNHDSELVVQNVNTWVREQKRIKRMYHDRMREQSKGIVVLSLEKDTLQDEMDLLRKDNKRVQKELDEKKIDYEKFRALQTHSSHQQLLLHQLRGRLEEHESDQDSELKEKLATIQDLHNRLKNNVDSVQQLNQQLSTVQKENVKIRTDLEREMVSRHSLVHQLEVKEQLVHRLQTRGAGATDTMLRSSSPSRPYTPDPCLSRSAIKHALDETGESDPQALDKSYWITRVAELSLQLQQTSDYWTDKVRQLSTQQHLHRTQSCPPTPLPQEA